MEHRRKMDLLKQLYGETEATGNGCPDLVENVDPMERSFLDDLFPRVKKESDGEL